MIKYVKTLNIGFYTSNHSFTIGEQSHMCGLELAYQSSGKELRLIAQVFVTYTVFEVDASFQIEVKH